MFMRCNEMGWLVLVGLLLTSCGGGSTGGTAAVAPIPAAPPAPAPATPFPTPMAPVPASVSTEFASVGSDIKIRYDAGSQKYEIMLPGQNWSVLTPESRSDYAFAGPGGAKTLVHFLNEAGKFNYTGFAGVHDSEKSLGDFAYGIATPASGVPVTGTASYVADLMGQGDFYSIGGTAKLDFDFAKGSLAGSMRVNGNDPAGWGPYEFGQYDFVRTVYSSGSPSFSGELTNANNNALGGNFSGIFTGPAAQELMGRWKLQIRDIYEPSRTIDASGVMVGKH